MVTKMRMIFNNSDCTLAGRSTRRFTTPSSGIECMPLMKESPGEEEGNSFLGVLISSIPAELRLISMDIHRVEEKLCVDIWTQVRAHVKHEKF